MADRGRPKEFDEPRVTKALRISVELDRRLKAVARERQVSANLLINAALEDFLDRLVPVDQAVRAAS